ncbi:hypothetical protein V8C86DRAFT_563899 [Haematococcus lacustris]
MAAHIRACVSWARYWYGLFVSCCLIEKGTARRTAHRVMAKKKRKGSDKKQKASRSPQGKQRQERRDGCTTRRRQVPEGAVLRGCKKTRRKLREHLRPAHHTTVVLRFYADLDWLRRNGRAPPSKSRARQRN